jgi:DNA-binding NtrC family response regulator
MERALILCRGNTIGAEQFPFHRQAPPPQQDPFGALIPLEELEIKYIRHVLSTVDNNYRKAAQILAINRNTIYNRLRDK